MSSEPSPNRKAGGPLGTADDLDALLSNAADLVRELGQELGADATPGAHGPGSDEGADDIAAVEAQLDDIEAMLDATGHDLGGGASGGSTSSAVGSRGVDRATAPPSGLEHQTENQSRADTPAAAPADVTPPSPAEGTLPPSSAVDSAGGRATPAQNASSAELPGAVASGSAAAEDPSGSPPLFSTDLCAPSPAAQGSAAAAASPAADVRPWLHLALPAAAKGLDVLDWLDRPFAWVGYRARRIVGYVALVLLLAAALIVVFSHMG